jgi:type IV pilus biogenesis protein CpaD/CtpE
MKMIAFLGGIAVAALALAGCASPEVVQATDCRHAVRPCGIVNIDHTDAMTSVPVTVPVSAVP